MAKESAFKTPFKLSSLMIEDSEELLYPAAASGNSTTVFIDSGASRAFISPQAVRNLGPRIQAINPIEVEIIDGGAIKCAGIAEARITIQGWISSVKMRVAPMPDENLAALGGAWLKQHNPSID